MADGTDNLIPFDKLSEDEQREIRRKGGIASGKVRREKKLIRDVASSVLSLQAPISQNARKDMAERWGVTEDDIDVMFVSIATIASKAMKGDTKAFEVIRDSAGQKPTDKVDMSHAFIGDFDIVLDGEDGD